MITLLSDGSRVKIRAIRAGDAAMLQAFVRRLSIRSRRFRFFTGLVELPAQLLERLVNPDHHLGLALVALSEQAAGSFIVAEARCVLNPREGDAEFAIAVADEFQHRGLGVRLLRTLVAYAAKRRIAKLFGEVLADNHTMLALARKLGFQTRANPLDRKTMIASIVPARC